MTGAIVLVVALLATVVLAVLMRRRDGRFRDVTQAPTPAAAARTSGAAADPGAVEVVSAEEIGADLGERLTLLQFSSAFCSPCRATRALLSDVVSDRPDVAHVEVDAESHLELVRRLNVMRTPTVLVVDPAGRVLTRASGLPRRDQVLAVLDA